jgi:hypothetical protein
MANFEGFAGNVLRLEGGMSIIRQIKEGQPNMVLSCQHGNSMATTKTTMETLMPKISEYSQKVMQSI